MGFERLLAELKKYRAHQRDMEDYAKAAEKYNATLDKVIMALDKGGHI